MKSLAEEMKSMFGKDVFNSSVEFNKNRRFTDGQVKSIERTCKDFLDSDYDKCFPKKIYRRTGLSEVMSAVCMAHA